MTVLEQKENIREFVRGMLIDPNFKRIPEIRSGLLRNHIYKLQRLLIIYNNKQSTISNSKDTYEMKQSRKVIHNLLKRIYTAIDFVYVENNEDCTICSKCRYDLTCCESCGCELSPYDLKTFSAYSIAKLIMNGILSIDCWEGDIDDKDEYDQIYYLRMRNDNDDDPIFNRAWFGKCVHLTENGCKYPFIERGSAAKYLIPSRSGCHSIYGKEECCKEWRHYQRMFKQIFEICEKKMEEK